MERDPLRFVRRKAAWHHVAAIALGVLALPFLWLGLDLVRVVVDEVLARPGAGGSVTLLRLAVPALEEAGFPGLVLWEGLALPRGDLAFAGPAALVGIGLVTALLGIAIGRLRSFIGARVVAYLRRVMIDAVIGWTIGSAIPLSPTARSMT